VRVSLKSSSDEEDGENTVMMDSEQSALGLDEHADKKTNASYKRALDAARLQAVEVFGENVGKDLVSFVDGTKNKSVRVSILHLQYEDMVLRIFGTCTISCLQLTFVLVTRVRMHSCRMHGPGQDCSKFPSSGGDPTGDDRGRADAGVLD